MSTSKKDKNQVPEPVPPAPDAETAPTPPATAADAARAAKLVPSVRKQRGWVATATLGETFANAGMQQNLRTAQQEFTALGIDVEGPLAVANEALELLGSLTRLDESAGRVHQRVVELNKRLTTFQTTLLQARGTAAPGTPIANATRGLAGLRGKQVAQIKKLRNKTIKAKKAAKKPTP